MKSSIATTFAMVLATTAALSAPYPGKGGYGKELDWVPKCGIDCVDYAVKSQGCDPLVQECYCGWGFFTPWKDCMFKTCGKEDLPNGYIWGITRCDPKSYIFVGKGIFDQEPNGTELAPLPETPPDWSASPTFISDSDWALETPRSIKSSDDAAATAELTDAKPTDVTYVTEDEGIAQTEAIEAEAIDVVEKRSIHTTAASESTTKASASSSTPTSTKPATITDSSSGITKASMASVGLASLAAMFLFM